jgi:glutathione peroxidase
MSGILDVPVKTADGRETTLAEYSGKVLLVVNVASRCGLTTQYDALESLFEEKRGQGLVVVAFPANNFKNQEPGTDEEIVAFCTTNYNITFPIYSKISVKGEDQHPLYQKLTASNVETTGEGPMRERLSSHSIDTGAKGDVLWNFEKFLVGRDGHVVARFAPDVVPDDPRLVLAIDREIAKAG